MSEAARLSKLLFEARELVEMYGDVIQSRTGQQDVWSRRVRDDLDNYRLEQGWSQNGYGGEQD